MSRRGTVRIGMWGLAVALAMPAVAQFSDNYSFLKAVRDADPTETQKYLDRPGAPALSSRDPATGESVLHILVKRHDTTWLGVMLARGAPVNIRDKAGDTALMTAALLSDTDSARLLLQANADVNAADSQGETPLIVAVQHRDLPMVRLLIANGADPKRADRIAGKTARDYAAEDTRGGPSMVKLLEGGKPAAGTGPIAGPVRR